MRYGCLCAAGGEGFRPARIEGLAGVGAGGQKIAFGLVRAATHQGGVTAQYQSLTARLRIAAPLDGGLVDLRPARAQQGGIERCRRWGVPGAAGHQQRGREQRGRRARGYHSLFHGKNQ